MSNSAIRVPFNVPSIVESLKADVSCGRITIREAAEELHEAGWTNFVDEEKTKRLLDLGRQLKMKIEKNSDGTGYVLTNSAGESLNVVFSEFWDICRAGKEIETKSEIENFLAQCPDISGHDLDRIRAFPMLVDKITKQVIQDRINDESGDQVYYAAEKCIKEHVAEVEDKVKWFSLSEDKCISVWYSPDEHDGDQFQIHLEEKREDGSMGPGCEIISSDSYATANISFEALCETLSEICEDAEVYDEEYPWFNTSNTAAMIAQQIFDAFGMAKAKKQELDNIILEAEAKKGEIKTREENKDIEHEI